MPIRTLKTCDICGDEVKEEKIIYTARYNKILYKIKIEKRTERMGPVNSVSQPIAKMTDDYLCKKCILNIVKSNKHDL